MGGDRYGTDGRMVEEGSMGCVVVDRVYQQVCCDKEVKHQ